MARHDDGVARRAGDRPRPRGPRLLSWDHAVKRGDIRALGALSYATPILSMALLIVVRPAEADRSAADRGRLVTVGAVWASRELWRPS